MKLIKISFIMILISIFIKFSGLFREIVIGKHFGVSVSYDQFVLASLIPIVLASSLASSINIISINYLSAYNNKTKTYTGFSNFVITSSIILTLLFNTLIYLLFYINLIDFIILAIFFILSPSIILFSLNGCFKSLLHYENKFYLSNFVALPYNLIIMFFVLIFHASNIKIIYLAIGTTLGVLAQTFLLYMSLKKNNIYVDLIPSFKEMNFSKYIYMFPFVIIGTIVLPLNFVLDRLFSINFGQGSISTFNYATNIVTIPIALIVSNIFSVYQPLITKLVLRSKLITLKKLILNFTKNLVGLSILLIAFSPFVEFFTRLLFDTGQFNDTDINKLASIIISYLPLIIGICLYELVTRILYIKQNKSLIMEFVLVVTLMNTILTYLLSQSIGINGVALATGFSFIISSSYYLYKYFKTFK